MKDRNPKRRIGFIFALNGLREAVRTERNVRIHIMAAFAVTIVGFYFDITKMEWALIIFSIGLVMITEIINTAIEKMLDYVKPAYHLQAKIVKDTAAGAVLLAAITASIVGLIIFLPALFSLF